MQSICSHLESPVYSSLSVCGCRRCRLLLSLGPDIWLFLRLQWHGNNLYFQDQFCPPFSIGGAVLLHRTHQSQGGERRSNLGRIV